MSSRLHRAKALAVLAIAALSGAQIVGCAEGRAPINQVQPGAVHRSVFEGSEWYYQTTVIDTPYSAGFTFVGEQGRLERIRWDLQEDYIVARRAYEHIANSEGQGIVGDATETGAPIAMYKVQYFDIRRAYNPVTGEEMNILTENSSDRPWYERDYLRVDWSENLIPDADMFAISRILDGIEAEPVAYYIEDPEHPHAPRYEVQRDGEWTNLLAGNAPINGDEPVQYIDIVNKMFVRPQSVEIPGFGSIPSCFLTYSSHLDCAPGEVTVRNSFLRVDREDTDYEPQLYTGDRMERFGYFVTERSGYDTHYGVVEPARYRFVNRHNLWQQSHRHTPEGELVSCIADSECGGGGSVCDLDLARAMRTFDAERGALRGACTIPFRERQVRPIRYYVTANFPESLLPDAQHLVDEWNGAFRETVASLREIECQRSGGSGCESERTREDHANMFVLCHNPVLESDHESCGTPGLSVRPGDLRYSIIGWVDDAHLSSPLGYGPSSADPLTGEIIMGNAFVYGAAMETLTAYARDIIRVLNGDLSEAQIMGGAHVQAWLDAIERPNALESGRTADDHVVHLDGEDAARINAAMNFEWAEAEGAGSFAPSTPAEFVEAMQAAENALHARGAFGTGHNGAHRLSRLVGTDVERQMTTPEMLLAAGIDPVLPLNDDILNDASPLRGASVANIRALQRARERMQADHCVLDAEFADQGLLGLAREINRAVQPSGSGTLEWYGVTYNLRGANGVIDYDLVREMLRHPIFDAVTAHEVGHTIGLRHNFSGSFDALNYRPRYWELRNDGAMAPRAWDEITQDERDGRILEEQYSTVMDYGQNFVVTDSNGIGHYDYAAIKMGYGDLVEVFTEVPVDNTQEVLWFAFIQGIGYPAPIRQSAFRQQNPELSAYVYTDWPQLVGGVENIQSRADVPYESLQPVIGFGGDLLVHVGPNGQRPIVPYLFCSDEQADLNPDCQRYDQGADPYESIMSVIDNYWNYYIFNSFRRGRLGFSPQSLAARVHGRYFEKLQRANQIYALYRGVFAQMFGNRPDYDEFWTDADGMGAWTLAVGAGFQLLTQVVTTPEPGGYVNGTRADGTAALVRSTECDTRAQPGDPDACDLAIDTFDGRAIETTWDFDAGYFWFDQLDRVGYFYDKVIALQVLVDPTTYFLGRDTDADIRQYQINFGSSFGNALSSFMQGVLAEDWTAISPRNGSSEDGLGLGNFTYPAPDNLTGEQPMGSALPIDPNASFSIQLYASVFGMGYIPQTYDQTFLNRSRIFVEGGAEELDLSSLPPERLVRFTNPESGLTYVAVSYEDERGREMGVGAQMLLHARELQTQGANGELRRYIDNLDLVRRLTWLLGFGAQP